MSSLRHINSSTSANHVLPRATGLVALLDGLVLPFTNRYKLNDGFGKATTPITPSCLRISPLTSRFSGSTGATLAPFFVILANSSNSELLADHLGMGLAWGSGAVLPCRGPLRHQGEERLESWRFAAGGRISRRRSGGRQSAQAAARIGPKPLHTSATNGVPSSQASTRWRWWQWVTWTRLGGGWRSPAAGPPWRNATADASGLEHALSVPAARRLRRPPATANSQG
jgi:hypothetical protein